MSATAAPYGLIPVEKQGGNPNQGGAARAYPITANITTALAVGQLAELSVAGVISVPAGAAVTRAIGVISGFEFTDPVMKYAVQDSMLPANAINSGYTNIKVFINDDPNQLYKIQSGIPVDQTKVGSKLDLANNQSVTTAVKRSAGNATTATAGASLLVIGFFDTPTSKPGDAFTDIIVKIAAPFHVYNI